MPASLTRRVTFAAAHRYRRPDWTEERNQQVFGRCAHPNYHGHSYVCDVTVSAPIAPETGMLIDLGLLDAVLDREVRARFDHKNINMDVPEFGEGGRVPTGEELARFIFDRVHAALAAAGASAQVTSVTVSEDATLSATWRAD